MLVPVMKPAVGKQFCLCSPADPASLFISWGAIFNTEYGSVVRTLSSGGGFKNGGISGARRHVCVNQISEAVSWRPGSDAGGVKHYLVIFTFCENHLSLAMSDPFSVLRSVFVPRCPSVAACWTSMGVNKV